MKTFDTEQEAYNYSNSNPSETVECKEYHYDGNLYVHCFYVDGDLHGECKEYHYYGNLYVHCFYVDGLEHGEFKSYHENGQLRKHSFYVSGEVFDVDHLRDGSYKSRCILSTLFNGNLIPTPPS